ncbi:MAG: hypothetical protein HYU41_10060 [Candidatus Rokubacteria bacterium]|nr:hypothetical protein [Candidatus Rokubacteria bacterium]
MNWLRTRVIAVLLIPAFVACATPEGGVGLQTFGRGVMNLVLAPLMIVSGIVQGLAFLPYTIGVGLKELNEALLRADAVPLDDSYKAAFQTSMNDPKVDQQTGEIQGHEGLYGRYKPEAMFEVNRAFHRLLVSQGMPEAKTRHYVLGGNYQYAWTRNEILLAVMYRHPGPQPFRTSSKATGILTTFRPDQRAWHEPYERDAGGQVIDEVIDWAALEYKVLRHDKVVATLLVLAAEAVKADKRAHDYWPTERRWRAGETTAIRHESLDKVKRALPTS